MRYGALLLWGIVVYAVMQLAWALLLTYGFGGTAGARILQLLVLIVVTTVAGRSLRFNLWKDILPYSFSWAVVVALLDAALSVPSLGWQIYYDWNLWLGYTLVVVVPLIAPYTRTNSASRILS